VDYLRLLKQNGSRLVLVLTGGSAIALADVADLADAILFVWYPGQEGGQAVADILFGVEAPTGKLPLTFPKSLDQLPPFEDYAMAGRTYRYATDEPQFPFGFGLGYTQFAYEGIEAPAAVGAGEPLPVRVTLRNVGEQDGEEVVQLYLAPSEPQEGDPLYTLIGFRRVAVPAGAQATVEIMVPPSELATFDAEGHAQVRPGVYRLFVGGSSPGMRSQALGAPTPGTQQFTVR
jgi:beta-glucosidase